MNKNFKIYALIWVIFLAVFNVICFVTPAEMGGMNKFGGAFWVGYIFITAAFIGQLICAYAALKENRLKRLFLKIPLISISYGGLVLMLIFGALVMIIPNLPNWVGIIVCFLILAFSAVAVIKAGAAAGIAADTEDKVKRKTLFIRSLTADAESLVARAKNDEVKAACKSAYEAIRYSDPMSDDALADVEARISAEFAKLTEAADKNDAEASAEISNALKALVNERNTKCRLLK